MAKFPAIGFSSLGFVIRRAITGMSCIETLHGIIWTPLEWLASVLITP